MLKKLNLISCRLKFDPVWQSFFSRHLRGHGLQLGGSLEHRVHVRDQAGNLDLIKQLKIITILSLKTAKVKSVWRLLVNTLTYQPVIKLL
jgi:hypothetical protein